MDKKNIEADFSRGNIGEIEYIFDTTRWETSSGEELAAGSIRVGSHTKIHIWKLEKIG